MKVEEVEINFVSDRPAQTIIFFLSDEPKGRVCRRSSAVDLVTLVTSAGPEVFREAYIVARVFDGINFCVAEVINRSDRVVLLQTVSVDVP